MREYVALVAGAGDDARVAQQIGKLDAAMQKQGGTAAARYQQGRQSVQTTFEDFSRQIAAANASDQPKLRSDSRLLTSYVTFDIDEANAQLLERLNE